MTAHSAQEVKAQKKNSPNGDTSNLMRQLVVAALRLSVFEDFRLFTREDVSMATCITPIIKLNPDLTFPNE